MIGLPSQIYSVDQNGALMSKATYAYDEGDFSDATLEQNLPTAIQHDNANYGATFTTGRGNMTSATRWDVNYPDNPAYAVTSRIKYNTAGAPVANIDPLNRTTRISYADSFNDGLNRNAYAYPTKLTDPAGNFSLVKYRFDIGANVWAKSPAPAGNSSGKETTREFDPTAGRLIKETILNTGAYTRYEYPLNGVQSKIYSTIVDTDSDGADDDDEVLTESFTDGAGRARQTRIEHPGSAGGWSGSLVEYDILGRSGMV